jgi:hypothetical protein
MLFEDSPDKYFSRPHLKNPFTKIGLVEWLRVKALSSSPSTAKTTTIKKCSEACATRTKRGVVEVA